MENRPPGASGSVWREIRRLLYLYQERTGSGGRDRAELKELTGCVCVCEIDRVSGALVMEGKGEAEVTLFCGSEHPDLALSQDGPAPTLTLHSG